MMLKRLPVCGCVWVSVGMSQSSLDHVKWTCGGPDDALTRWQVCLRQGVCWWSEWGTPDPCHMSLSLPSCVADGVSAPLFFFPLSSQYSLPLDEEVILCWWNKAIQQIVPPCTIFTSIHLLSLNPVRACSLQAKYFLVNGRFIEKTKSTEVDDKLGSFNQLRRGQHRCLHTDLIP